MNDNGQHDDRHSLVGDLAQHRAVQRSATATTTATDIINSQSASTRLYHRLNRGRSDHRHETIECRPPEPQPPDSIHHQRTFYVRALRSQTLRSSHNGDDDEMICSEAPFPTNMLESYRNREHERRIQTMLPAARSDQREKYIKLQEELSQRSGSLNSIALESNRNDPLRGFSELCKNEQKVYDEIFKKVINSESNRCLESSQVLEQIRTSYQEMFSAVPHYINKAQDHIGHMNSVLAQLEHQTELNRELQSRLSQIESEQGKMQVERDIWQQEKQKILEVHGEFQNNFLQLRSFWESERKRYEEDVKTLRESLQTRICLSDSGSNQINSIKTQMDSFISSALDILDSAPDFEQIPDSNNESNNRSSAAVSMISTTASVSNTNDLSNAEMSEPDHSPPIVALEQSDTIESDNELVSSSENESLSEPDTNPPFEYDALDSILPIEHDFMSQRSDSVPNQVDIEHDTLPNSRFESVRSALEPALNSFAAHHTSDVSSDLTQESTPDSEPIQDLSACDNLTLPDPALISVEQNVSELQDQHSDDGFIQVIDSEQEKVSEGRPLPHMFDTIPELIAPNSMGIIKPDAIEQSTPSLDQRLNSIPITMPPSEGDNDLEEVHEEISFKTHELLEDPSSHKVLDTSDNAKQTENFPQWFGENPATNRSDHNRKIHEYDLNSIDYLGGHRTSRSHSHLPSRLSTPGWRISTPRAPIQPNPHPPETPRFARPRLKMHPTSKSMLSSNLENLLKQARHHQNNVSFMTEQNVLKCINFILDSCFAATVAKNQKNRRQPDVMDLKVYIIGLMKEQHGIDVLVLSKWCEMLNSIQKYRSCNVFIDLFGDLLDTESERHVNILLRIRQLLMKSRYGLSIVIQDQHYICQDRAIEVIKSLFCDCITSSTYKSTLSLVAQACRPWSLIIHDHGSLDVLRRSQILSPRLKLNMMDLINPHDRRFSCHGSGIEVNRFIPLAYQGIRRAELEYEKDRWARCMFQSVDNNHDNFITLDQFSRALSSHTIPQLSNRQIHVLFENATQQAATNQMSLKRFRHVCSQLTHVLFIHNENLGGDDDHLRPTVERIIEKWTRLDPAYNKFVELICDTKSGFDICLRLSYARLVFEEALINGSKSVNIIEKYRLMLGIIAGTKPDSTVFMSNASLIRDIDRLEELVDMKLKMLVGPVTTHIQ